MDAPAEAPISGVVLAGGRSTRFGSDKAAAEIAGASLLERAVRLLESVLADVWVSVRPEQSSDALRSRFRCLFDRNPGKGPAAGLEAAHIKAPARAWLAIACDQPGLAGADLGRLITERDPRAAATAYCDPHTGAPQPLCAIYEPATLAGLARETAAGRNLSPRGYLASLPLKLMPMKITNINSHEDLRRFLRSGAVQPGVGV